MAKYFMIVPIKLHAQGLVANRNSHLDFKDLQKIGPSVRATNEYVLNVLKTAFMYEFRTKKPGFWPAGPPEGRKADAQVRLWRLQVKAGNSTRAMVDTVNRIVHIHVTEGDDIEFAIRCYTDEDALLDNLFYLKPTDKDKVKQGFHPASLSVV
jgi:hypothetical protein